MFKEAKILGKGDKMDKQSTCIYEHLNKLFGVASCELSFKNNFELLVAVILSARCTDKQVNKITPQLFEKFPDAMSLSQASLTEVERLIYSCGFYKNKAKSLVNMAKDLVQKFKGEVPNSYENLVSLKGVGRKTANVVLNVGFKKSAIAVDTHVFRVSNRLGLVSAKTPLECEKGLMKKFDKDKWGQIHHYLVLYGRYYCRSQNPKCDSCEFKNFCLYQTKNFKDFKY